MLLDTRKGEAKRAELISFLENALATRCQTSDARALALEVLEHFCQLTAPEEEDPVLGSVVARSFSGRGGGRSTKPGNIRLNIGSLFEAISAGTFTAISVAEAHWTLPFAAILLWNSVWKAVEVELSEGEVAVLWVMWGIRDKNHYVPHSAILPALNKHTQKNGLASMSAQDLDYALHKLERIGSIAKAKRQAGEWFLIEWIRKSYR